MGLRAIMRLILNFYCVLSSLIIGSSALDLPYYFPKCCLNDPYLNDCLLDAANIVRPFILNGIEEIQLSSLTPYVFPPFTETPNTVNANYTAHIKNGTLYGLENYNIISLRYDPLLLTLSGCLEIPQLRWTAQDEINGTLLQFPITGNVSFSAVGGPLKALFEIDGELVAIGNNIYFNPLVVKIPLIMDSIDAHIEGLSNATEELENQTNKMLHEHQKEVAKALTPILQELFETFVFRYVKFITSEIPYNRIFPCLF